MAESDLGLAEMLYHQEAAKNAEEGKAVTDESGIRIVDVEATYGAKGCGGLLVVVSDYMIRLIGGTGGIVSIGADNWEATERLVNEAMEHYRVLRS